MEQIGRLAATPVGVKNVNIGSARFEYKISGINQIQVKPEIGLTFAHVLRSVLRHDPDVIMVGEIRDPETASIAIQASLTGHLVLSTATFLMITELLTRKPADWAYT